jgi:hypothetical protein
VRFNRIPTALLIGSVVFCGIMFVLDGVIRVARGQWLEPLFDVALIAMVVHTVFLLRRKQKATASADPDGH